MGGLSLVREGVYRGLQICGSAGKSGPLDLLGKAARPNRPTLRVGERGSDTARVPAPGAY